MASLSRRSFLASSALAAAATAAVATGCAPNAQDLSQTGGGAGSEGPAPLEEQTFISSCRGNCMGGCPLEVTTREGKVVKITAAEVLFPEYRRICQRGRTHIQTVYNTNRIQYPLRRAEGTARGEGQWERISWDEAIGEICEKWTQYREQFGPQSIGFSFASGNYGTVHGANLNFLGYLPKLLNVMQATHIHHCYDNAFGRFIQQTGVNTASRFQHQLLDAKTIVVWGANPTESVVHMCHFILEAQEKGAKVVVIDPNFTIMASKADLWVPLRPGTDGALALTLSKMAVDTGVASDEDMKFHNTYPFLVKDEDGCVLRGSDVGLAEAPTEEEVAAALAAGQPAPQAEEVVMDADGTLKLVSQASDPQLTGVTEAAGFAVHTAFDLIFGNMAQWTPELCAEVTDVDEATQRELLRLLVEEKPATMVVGLGPDHYENGYMTYTAMGMLSNITGNLGLPGGGMDQYVMATLDFYANSAVFMPTGPTPSPQIVFTYLDEIMDTGKFNGVDVNLKSIFFAFHNALANGVDYNKVTRALDKLDLIVTADIVMTDTCRFSDIVLPASHWFEFEEVHSMYSPFVVHCEKAIEPLYESKPTFDMVQLLAKGLGLDEYFQETLEDVLAAATNSETWAAFGIDWDTLRENRIMPITGADGGCATGQNYGRADMRVNFYFGDVTEPQYYNSYYDMGQEVDWQAIALPHWDPPYEAWTVDAGAFAKNPLTEKYPLVYTSYRNKFKCHTQFGYNPWLLELDPEPYVMLNPADAEPRGIETGDTARVFNDRGTCTLKAVVNDGVRAGLIVIPKGWQTDQYQDGSAQELTSTHMNPVCFNSYFFDALCEVELAQKGGNE